MDLRTILTTKLHDSAWLDRYLSFVTRVTAPGGLVDRHHILPQATFPEFASLEAHPWNRVDLSPSDHLIAHYYLFRALPGQPSVRQAFRMMMGFRLKELQQSLYSEGLLQEIAAAYEAARGLGKPWSEKARQKRSDNMRGKPVHPKLTWKGSTHSPEVLQKKAEAMHQFFATNLEGVAALDAARPRGESHAFFGKERPAETRAKISASLTGKVATDLTRAQMSATHERRYYDAITKGDHDVFRASLNLATEVNAILQRRQFKVNGGTYNILTGLMLIRLGQATEENRRYWSQAAAWIRLSGAPEPTPLLPRDPSSRLGTGQRLLSGQLSAHDLRKVGLAKGVTQARNAYDAMPAGDHSALRVAWDTASQAEVHRARLSLTPDGARVHPIRSRTDSILFGMELILNGEALAENWERWRTAGTWLALSGYACPLDPAAFSVLQHIVPGAVRGDAVPLGGTRKDAHTTYTALYTPRPRPDHPAVKELTYAKGVKKARMAYDAIPEEERDFLLSAWATQDRQSMLDLQHVQVAGSRPFKVLQGMRTILQGDASLKNWDTWRQAALFLRLSGHDVPVTGEALAALDRVVPPGGYHAVGETHVAR